MRTGPNHSHCKKILRNLAKFTCNSTTALSESLQNGIHRSIAAKFECIVCNLFSYSIPDLHCLKYDKNQPFQQFAPSLQFEKISGKALHCLKPLKYGWIHHSNQLVLAEKVDLDRHYILCNMPVVLNCVQFKQNIWLGSMVFVSM